MLSACTLSISGGERPAVGHTSLSHSRFNVYRPDPLSSCFFIVPILRDRLTLAYPMGRKPPKGPSNEEHFEILV